MEPKAHEAIPLWLRGAGVIVAATVLILMVVSIGQPGTTARRAPPARPGTPTPSGPPDSAEPQTATTSDNRAATSVASQFADAYLTWRYPDGPPGTAARVQPFVTAALFDHFPEPTEPSPAPSASAAIGSVTVASSTATTQVVDVSETQHLLAQDGTLLASTPPAVIDVTVAIQGNGAWLVAAFRAPA